MNKKQVIAFNNAFEYEPTEREAQLADNMLAIWGKLEPAASKNPAAIRKGILFGMGLMQAILAGVIELPPVKKKYPRHEQQGGAG